jgi:hypothetical protein
MPTNVASEPNCIFTSWKEIAAFLGKGVRTVQRWERDYNLPVLRPNGKPLGVVSASRIELEAWWASHWSRGGNGNGGPSPVPGAHASALESIRVARELHSVNQQLLQQLMQSAESVRQECEALMRRIT